ncbi:MAG TPA: calcium-binding protein, partial [Stellaceae bacterium]
NAGPSGEIDFGAGIATNQLWLRQSGNDLLVNVMGTQDRITVSGWYGAVTSRLQEIVTADGSNLDTQLDQLVQAMASYAAANPGFDPTLVAQLPSDPNLQNALASAWHA